MVISPRLGTLVERTTRTGAAGAAAGARCHQCSPGVCPQAQACAEQMKLSLTYDRGKEMTEHRLFTRNTQMAVYFAYPQSPWERGTNENTNGLIRQYFPQGNRFQ
ncbi:MAG: IS30 family transposase [Gammaproteobacteria bacterium]|nr:IS30 family transposase [Gammaproteobacteria bacterium]